MEIREITSLTEAEIATVKELLVEVFGVVEEEELIATFANRTSFCLHLAMVEGVPAGFKLGYRHDHETFYSWLGGVRPAFRGRGIGTSLMRAQHAWCVANGFRRVQTRTKNKWRSMLILNLKHGFDIVGAFTDEKGEPKLMLEKRLHSERSGAQ
jgi:GNAT superfamily N-acetyltransferase